MNAIGKKKRGVWIGVYVLAEVFAFAAYMITGALRGADATDGLVSGTMWNAVFVLLFLIILAAEIGYALIWRMAVMYRGIRRRAFWIVLNIIGWGLRMTLILMLGGVIAENWMSVVPEPLSSLFFHISGFPPSGLLYVVLVWHDIVIWLNEPKDDRKKI